MKDIPEKVKLLIIDDDEGIRKTLSSIFRFKGYEVLSADTGKNGLDVFRDEKPNVILLDLKLDDMDGIEILKSIKDESPFTECIVFSGYTCQDAVIQAINLGACGYMEKPCNIEKLDIMIKGAVETQRLQRELKDREELFRTVVEASKDAIIAVDSDGLITIFNLAAEEIFGRKKENIIGNSLALLIPEGYREAHENYVKECFEDRIFHGVIGKTRELMALRSDGGLFPIELSLSAIQTRKQYLIIAIIRDITERKIAEEKIREREERFRAIVNTATYDAIISTDSIGNIIFWNYGAEIIFNYSAREVLLKNIDIIMPERFKDGRQDILHGMISMGTVIGNRLELTGLRKGGEEFPMELSLGSWHSGEKEYFTLIIRDISDRKELEVKLRKEKQSLEKAQNELINKHRELEIINEELKNTQLAVIQREKLASIGQLAAGVAHEINNPMGFITGNLRALKKYTDKFITFISEQEKILKTSGSPEALKELKQKRKKLKIDYLIEDMEDLLEESLEGADRVTKIVQDLKTFSRVDEAEYKMADINKCIKSTVNIVWNELKYKVTLNKDYGDIPETRCYPQQLNQVFMNLLINASHAIDKEGEISIRTWREKDLIKVSIEDNGSGIPKENLDKLFDPFFTTKEAGKGTGLGLSITYDIIKKHKGDIKVESTVGKGTIFILEIPVVEDE